MKETTRAWYLVLAAWIRAQAPRYELTTEERTLTVGGICYTLDILRKRGAISDRAYFACNKELNAAFAGDHGTHRGGLYWLASFPADRIHAVALLIAMGSRERERLAKQHQRETV